MPTCARASTRMIPVASFRPPFLIETGKVDRRIWEISLALAVRDALRAGNLFLAESRGHVPFWNLIYDDRRWQESRVEAYRHLDLPTDRQVFLDRIATALDQAARGAAAGLPRTSVSPGPPHPPEKYTARPPT